MIPVPSGVRVWLATGTTDMRRGMNGLALQVQQALQRDPHAGDLYIMTGWACRYMPDAGAGPVRLAIATGWRGRCHRRTTWLHAGGDRLVAPAANLAAGTGRLKLCRQQRSAYLIVPRSGQL